LVLEEAGAVVVEHEEQQSTPNKQVCCTVAEKDTYIKGNAFFGPLCTIEWVVQSLISQKSLELNLHPLFSFSTL